MCQLSREGSPAKLNLTRKEAATKQKQVTHKAEWRVAVERPGSVGAHLR